MSSIWNQVVIYVRLYCIWSQVSADGGIFQSNLTLTWNESRKYCDDIGKVLFDAKKNDSMASLMKSLKDTNQAWVSARVEISHFVKEPVCMATSKQFAPKESFDKDIIGNCFKFCNGYLYAGLKERDCYCFKDSTNLTRSTSCNSTCDNDPFHQCGGNESISLYEKVDKSITERIVHGCKACVYARATNGLLRLLTESCVGHMADGALCESVKYTACRYNWTVASNHLCRMDLANSLRWKKAKQYCADIGGHLMSSRLPTINTMIEHSTYWLGFSRVMVINKMDALDLVTNNICCAVARREGDFVLIEGDDCSAKHAFICQDESPERSLASPQSTYPGEQSKSEHTDEKIVYGVVAVSAMLLVAFVITALVCIFRRRQLSQERATHSGTQSKREPNQFMGKQISRLPSKPSRKTHPKKETTESSYENVSFVRGQQDDAMHQLGYSNFEYENIVFDNAHVQ